MTGTMPSALDVSVGDQITLRTGMIRDRNGHVVPDGTPVTFILGYPAERVELPRITTTTTEGIAKTDVILDRVGQLEIKAVSEPASQSTTLLLTIAGEGPAVLATEVPPPTVTPTTTATARPTRTPAPRTPTPRVPTATATSVPAATSFFNGESQVGWWTFWLSLASMLLATGLTTMLQPPQTLPEMVRRLLLTNIWGLGAYTLYLLSLGLGLTPETWGSLGAVGVTFVATLLPWVWARVWE
jgi:hypothetical protein